MNAGNEISEQWTRMMGHSDEHIRRIAALAVERSSLRRLFPFASHSNLRFSRTGEYPYDLDLPYVLTRPDGAYEARAGDHSVLRRGTLEIVVAEVASSMPVT